MSDTQDDEMPQEIDFAKAVRGKFYRPDMKLNLPVYLEDELQTRLAHLAQAKGIDISELVNALLRKDLELIETAL